jgi:YggT family protein
MNSTYMTDPVVFLINTLFTLYISAVLLRFLLQYFGADFYNPISQFLIKITHPPLKILRRFVPAVKKLDTASLVLAFVLQLMAYFFISLLKGISVGIAALAMFSLAELVELLLNIFVFAVFVRALLSWINPGDFNAASSILVSLTEPLLNICRKFIPDMGGIDLSPLIVLLLLQLAKMVLLPPLHSLASLVS